MDSQDKLRRNVVAIREPDSNILGTGFFIGNDGSLLTCFHVVGDKKTMDLYRKTYEIYFNSNVYPAECIFTSSDPMRLDMAVLRLTRGKLPSGAILIPLGKWEARMEADREFLTFGFRSVQQFMGLYASGIVRGRVDTSVRTTLLQLSSQASGQEEIRPGMSGSPIFYRATHRLVGMITTLYLESKEWKETIPLAIPIDAIAEIWQPLQNRFREQELYDELSHRLSPAKWFTPWSFERMTQKLPHLFGVTPEVLEGDTPNENLVTHLKNRKQIYTFIHWLQRNYDDLPIKELTLPTLYDADFVNRIKERDRILGGGAYSVLDAPTGYGKTALLREIEIAYIRKGALCLYVEIPNEPATCIGLATALQDIIGGAGVTSLHDVYAMGEALAKQLIKVKQQLDVVERKWNERQDHESIVLLIDNVERLSDEEATLLTDDFIPAMQVTLRDPAFSFRVHFAGRYVGRKLRGKIKPAVIALTPFEFNIIMETMANRADTNKHHYTETRAAHLMHMTGGHPGCMAHILKNMKYTWPPNDYFREHYGLHKKAVLESARSAQAIIPTELRQIFEVLSFFRRFNHRLLRQMIDKGIIDWDTGDVVTLSNHLTQTYLINRKQGFLQDEIVRRLLNIRMRWEEPERFIALYKTALEIYETNLTDEVRYPEAITIEAMFTELQLRYYSFDEDEQIIKEADITTRQQLAEHFFAEDGILQSYLCRFQDKYDAADILESMRASLDKDWEFQFTLNYFSRQDNYDVAVYNKMDDHIEGLISQSL